MTKTTAVVSGAALALVGALARWWWPFVLGLAGGHSSEISGLSSLVQLVLWVGGAVIVLARLLRAPKEKAAPPRELPLDLSQGGVIVGGAIRQW